MTIFNSVFVDILCIFFFLLCCYAILKKLGLRKIFPVFLIFTLSLSSFFLSPQRKGNSPEITPEYREQIIGEQVSVASWYTEYKKDLTQTDLYWQQYHKQLASFTNDEISIQTLSIHLRELNQQIGKYQQKYEKMRPPSPLRPETENALTEIITKTEKFIARQNDVVKRSLEKASAADFTKKPHLEQVQVLEKIMVLDSPPSLDTAAEISHMQELLTIPNEK